MDDLLCEGAFSGYLPAGHGPVVARTISSGLSVIETFS